MAWLKTLWAFVFVTNGTPLIHAAVGAAIILASWAFGWLTGSAKLWLLIGIVLQFGIFIGREIGQAEEHGYWPESMADSCFKGLCIWLWPYGKWQDVAWTVITTAVFLPFYVLPLG